MNRNARMLLLTSRMDRNGDGRDYDRPDYAPDARFRDRRGREHYDNGRFAPQNEGGMRVDGRYWDERRFPDAPMGNLPMTTPYVPPVYQDYGERGGMRPMNKIGFSMEGEMDRIPPEFNRQYRADAGHRSMDETAYRRGGESMSGHGSGSGTMPLTRELAQEWVQRMRNADGTTGPHWTMDKTEEARAQRGIDCDPLAFYVAMNMVYSDYSKVAERVNANSMDFYVYMAKAFLEDKDVRHQGAEKLARYYEYVVM